MKVQVRLNAISSYQSQQSSPAIRDIAVSGHPRHHRLRPSKTSPSPAIQDLSVSGHTRHFRLRSYKTSTSPAETCICNRESRSPTQFSSGICRPLLIDFGRICKLSVKAAGDCDDGDGDDGGDGDGCGDSLSTG